MGTAELWIWWGKIRTWEAQEAYGGVLKGTKGAWIKGDTGPKLHCVKTKSVLLYILICLNNLIKHRGTWIDKAPFIFQVNLKIYGQIED